MITVHPIPKRMPGAPAFNRFMMFKPAPSGNAKNGISMEAPGSQNLRISSSRLPRMQPTITGMIHPTKTDIGIFATPAAPNATMVKNGPSLMDRMETAPTSVASPYSPARAAYRPPFELASAPTIARVDRPRKPASPKSLPQIKPMMIPIPTFTSVIVTPL